MAHETAQQDYALDSLLTDGLVEQTTAGLFALAGEGDDAGRRNSRGAGIEHRVTKRAAGPR
jgi:hypothetical protein